MKQWSQGGTGSNTESEGSYIVALTQDEKGLLWEAEFILGDTLMYLLAQGSHQPS